MAVNVLDFIRAEFMADYRPYHVVALHFLDTISAWNVVRRKGRLRGRTFGLQIPEGPEHQKLDDRKLSMIT
jgi:hypothetical protein